ncbi:MAG TPA: NAD(P)/FAD-dependent oxidoreductase [Stellaceae bacterium]|jgi:NADPH-dependent 2,4-dienoyl-CoA reductase/sulfur reductase-like enzyme
METLDLAIVGAGPAGLAAAIEAVRHGLSVAVFDEQATPGGQVYRAVESGPFAGLGRGGDGGGPLGADYASGARLAAAFRASGAAYFPGSTVWSLAADGSLGVSRDGSARLLSPRRVLLAMGAIERPVCIPGWTLPGVMTAGAAQILLKSSGLAPEPPVVLAGSGPLLYLLAWQYRQAGVAIDAVLETTPAVNYAAALPYLAAALRGGGGSYVKKGLSYIARLRRDGVRIVHGVAAIRALGDGRLDRVEYEDRRGRTAVLPARVLLLHEGVIPNVQASLALGLPHAWDGAQLCWRPETDGWGGTANPVYFIAGDMAGIAGAAAAVPSGRLAALAAASALGWIDYPTRDQEAKALFAARLHETAVRPFLDRLYRPRRSMRVPADDATIVCRCEETTAGAVREAVRLGALGPNQLKAYTRCGMGACQGRLCGPVVSELIAAERGVSVAKVGHYRPRPPLKPVTLGEIAALESVDAETVL